MLHLFICRTQFPSESKICCNGHFNNASLEGNRGDKLRESVLVPYQHPWEMRLFSSAKESDCVESGCENENDRASEEKGNESNVSWVRGIGGALAKKIGGVLAKESESENSGVF